MTPVTDDYDSQTPGRPKGRPGTGFNSEYPSQMPRLKRKTSSRSQTPRRQDLDPATAGNIFYQPWHVESNQRCNGGLKNAVASVDERLKKKLWIGTLGTNTDILGDSLRKDIDKRMLEQYDSQPVWIPDAEFESCYDEFCHQACQVCLLHGLFINFWMQVLWPCLHYAIPDAPKTKLFYESASFKQYVAVNQRFADAIVANYREGDISQFPSTFVDII
jgi:trehalose 6-phosphate synthase complex regulatory subunit